MHRLAILQLAASELAVVHNQALQYGAPKLLKRTYRFRLDVAGTKLNDPTLLGGWVKKALGVCCTRTCAAISRKDLHVQRASHVSRYAQ
jgi:hypothetical protein